jgi:hypothetical protein
MTDSKPPETLRSLGTHRCECSILRHIVRLADELAKAVQCGTPREIAVAHRAYSEARIHEEVTSCSE